MKKSTFLALALGLFLFSFNEIKAQTNPTTFVVHAKSDVRASMAYMLNSTPTTELKLRFINSNNQMVKEISIAAGSATVSKVDISQLENGVYTVELYNHTTLIQKESDVQITNH